MFEFRLILRRAPDGRLILRFSRLLRSLFFALAGLVILAMVISEDISVMGILLAVATLAGGLFEERWVWNPAERCLSQRSGFLPFVRRRAYPAERLQSLELRRFTRGQGGRTGQPDDSADKTATKPGRKNFFATRMIGLGFEDRERGMITIETHRLRNIDDLSLFATLLAEAVDVPLTEIDE